MNELERLRTQAGLSRTDVMERTGIFRTCIEKWEWGASGPSKSTEFLYKEWLKSFGKVVFTKEEAPKGLLAPSDHKRFVVFDKDKNYITSYEKIGAGKNNTRCEYVQRKRDNHEDFIIVDTKGE